jgi:transcriptional regulator with XRE-family HTH domain
MVNRLKSTRETAGLSLLQVQRMIGCSPSWIIQREGGLTQPNEADLRVLAALYGCSVAWLRGETAELSDEAMALLRTVEHTSDRATLHEFMLMISTRDPDEPSRPSGPSYQRAQPSE